MKTLFLLLGVFPLSTIAQLNDSFADGDYTQNPAWQGDSAKFTVQTAQLKLSAPAVSGTAYLFVPSQAAQKATWTFWVNMAFNPSSSNYCKVYLVSDQPILTSPLNGYFIKLGGTDDKLSLYRQQGTTETLLINGRSNMFNTSAVKSRIQITRDETGTWELNCDTTGGTAYKLVGKYSDQTFQASSYFGVQCTYTSTRSDKFYFDDFVVTGEPYAISLPKPDSSNLFDIVFNEVMADPSPVAGLPDCEYVELYNRTSRDIHLKNWKIYVGSDIYTLPNSTIKADNFVLICSKNDTSRLSSYGNVIGLFSSSATLNNSGEYLKLVNPENRLIARLEYSEDWYSDYYKTQGGWSLEQIDPLNPCGGKTNWTASRARDGGTPGAINSVNAENADTSVPEVFRINIPNNSTIDIYFTEPVDSCNATNRQTYTITPGNTQPKKARILDKNFHSVRTTFDSIQNHTRYTLAIANTIKDCVGNRMGNIQTIPFSLPATPDSADIIINEVLFDAFTEGEDYIELYNRSAKTVNSRNLLIGVKSSENKIINQCRISETGFIVPSGSYLVITKNKEKVKSFYQCGSDKLFAEPTCMPSLNDKSATLVLLNDQFSILDQFSYTSNMHLAALNNIEGIALERINPNKSAYFPGNWHSASQTARFGTPGLKNSQYLSDSVTSNEIYLEDQFFSPDNDGVKDILKVSYKFNKPCLRAQVNIFDCTGKLTKRLLNNEVLGTEGFFTWDGTNDIGRRCTTGMYVIFIRIVSDDGSVKDYKKTCVLAIKR